MEINVLIEEGVAQSLEAGWLQDITGQVLVAQGAGSGAELGLVIAGQERVRQLNRDYLGRDEPTDVIAFALLPEQSAGGEPFVPPPDGLLHLGEVIISYPQAVAQAEEQGHAVNREIAILIIHGVLHLLGYDDEEPERKREMSAREKELLSQIEGVGN